MSLSIQQQAVHYRMDDIGCMIEDFLASRSCQLLAMSSLQNATTQYMLYMLLLFFDVFWLFTCLVFLWRSFSTGDAV